MNSDLYFIQCRSELASKCYIFMEDDKIISMKNLLQHLLSAEILSEYKNWIYITIFSEKFSNQCKKQTNSKVYSNILPSYKAWPWKKPNLYLKNKLGPQDFLSLQI